METVAVDLGEKSYPIYIGEGILSDLTVLLSKADKWLVITDENVDHLYSEQLAKALGELPYKKLTLVPGESSKSFQTVEQIISAMVEARLTRHSAVIAFGGGVIGDLAGFCSSIYMRGISYVQIPTTLLAQVDSSVGGKTGVNVQAGKNMAGTFYQPQVVIIDTALLQTLPIKELTAGLGEVIKYGIIDDYELLNFIEHHFLDFYTFNFTPLNELIRRCCEIKADVVAKDECETGLRKILNFGHTLGHAIETLTGYQRYLHGEAVLIGMYYETLLAQKMGLISEEYGQQINTLISRTGLSMDISDIPAGDIVRQMTADKKNSDGVISFILPTGQGQVAEYTLTSEQALAFVYEL